MIPMPDKSSSFPKGQVIYQIYPRSFKDTDGDGIGDLSGMIEKLDYVQELGATAIWINPIHKSPMADFGYDISDYYQIDPLFGTLEQYERLLKEAHLKHIQVIMDLVVNHTSDQHAWFQESRSSRDNPKRDWYVWKDAQADGSPPNNWLSVFGGTAWEFDNHTKQYFLHSFLKEQPDLNWQNPEVREAIKAVIRYWLDKGVDGLRMDAVYWYSKDPDFKNDPTNPDYRPAVDGPYDRLRHIYSKHGPFLYDYLNELVAVLKQYESRYMITELSPHHYNHTVGDYINTYQKIDPLILAPFNFMFLSLPWDAQRFQRKINAFQAALKLEYTPIYLFGNHDQPRLASRIGHDAAAAAALLLLTLPGTAVIYYGEEIGMENVSIPKDLIKDTWELNIPNLSKGRDPERSPMQWSSDEFGGFSTAVPWLPLAASYIECNIQKQLADPASLLNLYKHLLTLRKRSVVLKNGDYLPMHFENPNLFGFSRSFQNQTWATIINFSHKESAIIKLNGKIVVCTVSHIEHNNVMQPLEGRVIEIQEHARYAN